MKAKHKVFREHDYKIDEEMFEDIDSFVSELGPQRVISVILRPVDGNQWDDMIVFYWEANDGKGITRHESRVMSIPPILTIPRRPIPPGTIM